EDIPGGGFASVAHWPADRGAAAEAHDTDGGVERVAAADFIKMAGVRFGAASGNTTDPKGQIAHGNADTENPRRSSWRFVVKIHTGIRHAGSACCRNQCPELMV